MGFFSGKNISNKIENGEITLKSPRSVSKILVASYPNCDYLSGLFIRYRPYICPFHELVKYVPISRSILDVGCGVGIMTILLAQLGKMKRGIGVDTSHKAIDVARTSIIPHDCDLSFRCLSQDDPWPDEEFDTIVCIDVLHHVPPQKQQDFIKKLTRVGQGSRVIFKDVSPKPFWKALANVVHDLLINRQWISIQDEEKVKKWFQNEGFSVIEQRRLDMLWYSHYLLVAEREHQK